MGIVDLGYLRRVLGWAVSRGTHEQGIDGPAIHSILWSGQTTLKDLGWVQESTSSRGPREGSELARS